MFMLGRRWGMLGADIDAWDVPALRVRAAAIVMVVAVSAGLPHLAAGLAHRPVKAAINDLFTTDGAGVRAPDLPTRDRPARTASAGTAPSASMSRPAKSWLMPVESRPMATIGRPPGPVPASRRPGPPSGHAWLGCHRLDAQPLPGPAGFVTAEEIEQLRPACPVMPSSACSHGIPVGVDQNFAALTPASTGP